MSTSVSSPGDTQLARRVENALQGLGYSQLTRIDCEADGTTVTLRGMLASFYLKQIAQTIALKIPGVHRVKNEIEVQS